MINNVALVTGGTRGIGLGIAENLAQAGYDLALCGVREEGEVQDALFELRHTYGIEVFYQACDISDADARERLLEAVREHFGALNVLVNNAGVAPRNRKDILEVEERDYDWLMKINLNGPFFLSQAVSRWMLEQKAADAEWKGCMVNIGSISATVVSCNRPEYCLSKTGIGMMTQLFAARLGEADIPVYEIRPGVTASDMTSGVKEKYDKLIEEGLCVQKRWGLPEDVGKAVAALANGHFPYSTGQVIMVDGGLTMPRPRIGLPTIPSDNSARAETVFRVRAPPRG